jgi:hypothetical protein
VKLMPLSVLQRCQQQWFSLGTMTLLAEGRPEGISKLPLSLSCEVELEVGLVSPAPLSHAAQPTLSV